MAVLQAAIVFTQTTCDIGLASIEVGQINLSLEN